MPAFKRKLPGSNKFRVYDNKGHIHSYRTSRENADKQIRLLNGISHGMKLRKG